MSDEIVRLAREAASEARDAFAQDWLDAEVTGERPDLMRIEAEIPVEWIVHMADRIEELEAKLAKIANALADLADCVDLGCYCSEMQMATAVDNARTTLAEINGGGDT